MCAHPYLAKFVRSFVTCSIFERLTSDCSLDLCERKMHTLLFSIDKSMNKLCARFCSLFQLWTVDFTIKRNVVQIFSVFEALTEITRMFERFYENVNTCTMIIDIIKDTHTPDPCAFNCLNNWMEVINSIKITACEFNHCSCKNHANTYI